MKDFIEQYIDMMREKNTCLVIGRERKVFFCYIDIIKNE
jgi:hypothetical protein